MRSLQRPAALLLGRMKYKQKAILLGVVVLIPLIVTTSFLISDIYERITFVRQERMGIEYGRPLMQLLQDMQQHRAMSVALQGGDASFKDRLSAQQARIADDVAAVDSADRRLGPRLRTTGRWDILRKRVRALNAQVRSMDARRTLDAHNALIAEILSLVIHVGNTSNLILDPRLDSYHLSNAIITLLPALSEYMGQERAIGAAMAVSSREFSTERSKLIVLRGKALAIADMNAKGFDVAFQERPSLQSGLVRPLDHCHGAVHVFQEVIREKLIGADRVDIKVPEYYRIATEAIDTVFAVYRLTARELDAVLAARIAEDIHKGGLAAAIALLALGAAIWFFVVVHMSIKSAISDMIRLAEGLAAGDSGVRLETASRDELGDLARHLNRMAVQIGQQFKAHEFIKLQAAALDAAGEAIVVTDRDGSILFVNNAFCRQNGYTVAEVVGKNPRILRSGLTDGRIYPKLWETILSGAVWNGEVVNRRCDGSTYAAALTIAPVRDAQGRVSHYIAAHHDLTERRKAEAQLLQAQKMETVGRLAGGVAHDFNNLLTAIAGYSSFLLQNLKSDDPNRADVLEIKAVGERAAALTKQLLIFSRKQMFLPQRLDIDGVVGEMHQMLRRIIGEHIDLVFMSHGQPLAMKMDKGQFEQIILNLAVNARDAMPQGGRIVVESAPIELKEARSHRHGKVPPGSYVLLSVRDTGCGMSEEVQTHLFEPFFTTKEPGKGTGLGLSTVYGIIEQNRGFIEVDSEPGRGTAFKIYLPKAPDEDERPQAVVPKGTLPAGAGTVLVLEDDPSVRELARRALAQNGFTVLVAADPLEAVSICEGLLKEPLRLLLTDMVMSKMSGPEAALRIQALHPEIKILYMSGYTEQVVPPQSHSPMAEAFLMKPFTPDVLLDKVHATLTAS